MNDKEQKKANAAEHAAKTAHQTSANQAEPAAHPEPAKPQEAQPPALLTPQELSALKERASKADEYWDRLLRQTADLENFKKRAARERQDAVKFANEGLLSKLITVLDTFEMALTAANNVTTTGVGEAPSAQSLHAGVTMIQSQLKNVLTEAGLEEIDATGKVFDHNFHEAVAQKETADVPEGSVAVQLRKGYKYRDRLLRAASVVVAKKPAA